ncbi:hypothetical protein C8J57DRAFT_1665172 [Mycena rebaudengoi]|nr:hypothetical protein C8J57DRAFT_1665172 [Mycena rebaudengoi]
MASNDSDIELLQLIADSRFTGYFAAASLAVLLYDHIVCFREEVELMWSSRWGLAKILWNRYFSLIAIRYPNHAFPIETTLTLDLYSLNASAIFRQIGTEAPAQAHKPVIARLNQISNFAAQGVDNIRPATTIHLALHFHGDSGSYDHGRGGFHRICANDGYSFLFPMDCNNGLVLTGWFWFLNRICAPRDAMHVPRFLTLYAAAPLLVTFIMFAMTVYKCGSTLRRNADQIMPVWRLFLRDGVLWFLAVFAAAGAALLIWTMRRSTLKQLLVVPSTVVYSVVASRTLLNIKAIMAEEQDHVPIDGSKVKSDIVFVPVCGSGSTFASASAA